MVDRLFWRAGFGPSAEDRATWTGKPVSEAVACAAVGARPASAGPPGTRDGKALDPTGDDTDLVLSWVDRMVRSTQPVRRAHGRSSGTATSPTRATRSRRPQLLLKQNDLFRRYSDFGANPGASFRDLAYEVTVDPSMLRYLTGEYNVKGAPNENYAPRADGAVRARRARRERQADLQRERRAPARQGVLRLADQRHQPGRREELLHARTAGTTARRSSSASSATTSRTTPSTWCSSHPRARAATWSRKLWSEFVAAPPDAATLQDARLRPTPAAG